MSKIPDLVNLILKHESFTQMNMFNKNLILAGLISQYNLPFKVRRLNQEEWNIPDKMWTVGNFLFPQNYEITLV